MLGLQWGRGLIASRRMRAWSTSGYSKLAYLYYAKHPLGSQLHKSTALHSTLHHIRLRDPVKDRYSIHTGRHSYELVLHRSWIAGWRCAQTLSSRIERPTASA